MSYSIAVQFVRIQINVGNLYVWTNANTKTHHNESEI
jgi:hypothetical protein